MKKESIEKIALALMLLFFCTSFVVLAVHNYTPPRERPNWEFVANPDFHDSSPAFIFTAPTSGEVISGQITLILKYEGGSGHCDWSFDGVGSYSMMYYGEENGIQECQGIFDTTPQENGPHTITFRIWLLNGSKLTRVVNITIDNP